jgi:Zn-dependent protease
VRGFTLGRVWEIPVRVGPSLVVFLPVLVWLIASSGQIEAYAGLIGLLTGVAVDVAALQAGATPWLVGTLAAVGLFASVLAHELGHSWAALRYGVGIRSITLWVLGGLAALESVPREPEREFFIAVAGPAVSLLVAVACGAVTVALPAGATVARFVFGWLALTNVALVAFNLLPAFPMDGGRVFRALLARSMPYAAATRTAARVGVGFAVLFAVAGVLAFSPLLLLLAVFVYGAARGESRAVLLAELLAGVTVADVMTPDPPTVGPETTLAALTDRMLADRRTTYPVLDGEAVLGVVALDDLRRAESETVRAATREVPRLAPEDDAFEAFARLSAAGATAAVVERDGRLVGLVTEREVADALALRREFAS